jgi:VWFA-related protein
MLLAAALLSPQDPIIRVDVNVVQVDVTVTDRSGKHVSGLAAQDFEVFQNGKKQQVLGATWVEGTAPGLKEMVRVQADKAPALRQLSREQVRRVIILFVDDLSLSPPSMYYTKEAIQKFTDANIAEGDLIALFRASSGSVFAQQFTNDREQLAAAVRGLGNRQMAFADSMAPIMNNQLEDDPDPTIADLARSQRLQEEIAMRERQDQITAGVLTTLRQLIQGLGDWPGRKSVIFFGESIQLADSAQAMFNPGMNPADNMRPGALGGTRRLTIPALRQLTETANRNGVVLYTIDPRGLPTLNMGAQDMPSSNVRRMQGQLNQRNYEFIASQDGMAEMAAETGGLFFQGTNDITRALSRAVEDQEGYYLLAFRPDEESFERSKQGAKYHKLNVKVRGDGLNIRFRKGYVGVTDEEYKQEKPAPVLQTMLSPFRSTDIPMRLTPFVRLGGKDEKGPLAGVLQTGLHIAGNTLEFEEIEGKEGKGPQYRCELETAIFLFDLNGRIIERATQEHTITAGTEVIAAIRKAGLVMQMEMSVRKAGAYQLRAAVMEKKSQRAGSSVRFLEVADLSQKKLETTELIVNGANWQDGKNPVSGPHVRRLALGEALQYLMLIYNATPGRDGKPALEMQSALYKDGKRLFLSPAQPVNTGAAKPGDELSLASSLNLGPKMPRGEYTLEVAVRDTLAPKKRQHAVRTITFEILDNP